ncbi:MAG: thioredoxin domain-containing protein [Halobacteriaceae archaeon]
MSAPTDRNRLTDAPSPYLRQHADNPVHWQPWDDAALEAARETDRPIFLSIGYAACHWCHVMAEESFADPEIAAVLNEHFVPIKVDREERPDVDDVYMTVHQMVRGGGGWPLSVFLTPDLEPFYVDTYLPPEPARGRQGFKQLCTDIAEAWQDPDQRAELEERAAQWAAAATDDLESVPAEPHTPDEGLLASAATDLVRQADRDRGGFGSGQKFPQPGRLFTLLRATRRTGNEEALAVATETLDAMAEGGLRDHLGGGFHRYCTDREWTVPHFEKMLYDNAELARLYLAGYRQTGRESYATVTRDTLEFLDTELRQPDGGFYSSLDARSGDEEGRFYVWTPDEVREAVEAADVAEPERVVDVASTHYGVDEAGDVEGRSVLTLAATVEEIAAAEDRSPSAVAADIERAQDAMLAARGMRDRPPRDEKILAGWNGLAISAFAAAGLTLEPAYSHEAVEALHFAREQLWDDGQLYRRYSDGDVGVPGYLEDYAYLARGALDCFQATGEVAHLRFAVGLAEELVDRFYDPEHQTLYSAATEAGSPLARPQQLRDQSTPSPVGVAVDVLLGLAPVAPDAGFGDVAEAVCARHGESIENQPGQYATLVGATDRLRRGIVEVTVAGSTDPEWRRTVAGVPEPDRVFYHRPPDEAGLEDWLQTLDLSTAPPVWAGREVREDTGRPTAYVCRRSCSPPLSEAAAVVEWLEEFGTA